MRRFSLLLALSACASHAGTSSSNEPGHPPPLPDAAVAAAAPTHHTLIVVGTSDLHGHLEMLPIFAGYLANLRAAHPGDVLLVDAGDLFQGTLESNLNEGASIVLAYDQLGYSAAAIGNHEFDFGPVGERTTPKTAADDPRGALKARAAEAHFKFLAANVVDQATHQPIAWPNVTPSTIVLVAGTKVGIIGVATLATPHTTIATNFVGLEMSPLADAIAREAAALRQAGATAVVVVAHAGADCKDLAHHDDLTSCHGDREIFDVAAALPPGAVDAIVAGHTHAGVAHVVAGIPIVESFAKGIAFGRIDLPLDAHGAVTGHELHQPQYLCQEPTGGDPAACIASDYEGKPVTADPALTELATRYRDAARQVREAKLGVTLTTPIERAYGTESALGNLFADLMRQARPKADVAITNGGGLRADLPAGALTYGALYEAMPFDNLFAIVRLSGADLAAVLAHNLARDGGIFSLSGMRATARCDGATLVVDLVRPSGKKVRAKEMLTLATSDFLAVGGDGMLAGLDLPASAIKIEEGVTIRDELARVLGKRGGSLAGDARTLLDPKAPRLAYPGERPVHCP